MSYVKMEIDIHGEVVPGDIQQMESEIRNAILVHLGMDAEIQTIEHTQDIACTICRNGGNHDT